MTFRSSSRVHSMLNHAVFIAGFILPALWAPLATGMATDAATGTGPGTSQDSPTSTTFECIGSYNEQVVNFRQADAPDGHTYLFLRQGYTLRVLDASDPAHPAEINKQRFDAEIDTLAVRWPVLYVGCEDETRLFDVSDPAHPQLRASLKGGRNLSFNLMGHYLLVETHADRNLEFTVYDIKKPDQPIERLSGERNIGNTNLNKYFFATDGKSLFHASKGEENDQYEASVAIQDVTDSATTLGRRVLPVEEFVTFAVQKGQLIAGDTVTTSTITLTRVEPATPVYVYNGEGLSVEQEGLPETNQTSKITCKQTENGLKIFAKTDATSPTLCCVYGEHAGAAQIKLDGQRGYLLDDDGGLQILDLADPAQPRCMARHRLDIEDPVIRSATDGLVFISGAKMTGLRILNCVNPTTLTLCGEYRGGTGPMSVQGRHAYIAAGEGGLQILNIDNPAALQLLGRYATPNPAADLVTSGSLVYVLAKDLLVVDTSNPAKPVLVGSTPLGPEQPDGNSESSSDLSSEQVLKRLGPALYVIESGGLHRKDSLCQVIDVTSPTRPRLMPGRFEVEATLDDANEKPSSRTTGTPAIPHARAVASPYTGWFLGLPASDYMIHDFSSDRDEILALFDLTDPLHPRLANNYNALHSSEGGVTLRKGLIYHADGPGGLVVLRPARQDQ